MANPRKFSEKIALHHQKQAEETAAFEQIMREVSDATSKPEEAPLGQYGLTGPTTPQSQTTQNPQQQTRGRTAGVGPMRARPQDRKIDTSPYGSTAYLSPPPDSSWRRTNSDSALHQSSTVPRDISPQGGSPHHHHHGPNHHHHQASSLHHHHHHSGQLGSLSGQLGQLQQHSYSHSHHGLNTALHHSPHMHRRDGNNDGMISMLETNPNRPRSSCDVPRVPGIHIYPSAHEGGSNQIPVGSNTGSLPDLTSVHFPAPALHSSPLDRDNQDHSSSPYSTSPVSASPATLSPTSVPPLRQGHSPHHSPRSTPQTGSPTAPAHHYTNHHTPQNHLSVPNSNRYLHLSKGVALESSWGQNSYQQQCSPPSLHSSHSNINISSPTVGVAPSQIGGASNGGYRSPRSPGSSPGGAGGGGDSPHYDASGGATYNSQSADNFYITQALQQHFEHFSMMDSPATSVSYINNVNPNQSQFTQATLPGSEGGGGGGNISWAGGGGGCSGAPACLQAGNCLGGASCMPGPHPNTPTTIPDIILTDFSSTNSGDLSKDLQSPFKELSSNISSHFDTSLFPEDESLRDGLTPLDFDGLQMLTDPDMNVISDPTTEDAFRLDRL
ncbi:CREB-regulated transcription coactivator 1-like isoform X2 [Arctopsyche grandis]|uniref:CREB-regulated transcription coactivator 1-like isoform X2 n=1 Tax=Arctopsyche grandis TaxID=121162 RepID=UPI00406D734B